LIGLEIVFFVWLRPIVPLITQPFDSEPEVVVNMWFVVVVVWKLNLIVEKKLLLSDWLVLQVS
jgi:hypothetical protein